MMTVFHFTAPIGHINLFVLLYFKVEGQPFKAAVVSFRKTVDKKNKNTPYRSLSLFFAALLLCLNSPPSLPTVKPAMNV